MFPCVKIAAWLKQIPFGKPVLPLLNSIRAVSSKCVETGVKLFSSMLNSRYSLKLLYLLESPNTTTFAFIFASFRDVFIDVSVSGPIKIIVGGTCFNRNTVSFIDIDGSKVVTLMPRNMPAINGTQVLE